jgi:hypothetical protein
MSCDMFVFLLESQYTCSDLHESITYATSGIVTDDSAIFVANMTCNGKAKKEHCKVLIC